jgi:hypothetical protein
VKRVGALLLVVAAAGGAGAVASASQSPEAVRASIFDAARSRHSVHYVSTSVGPAQTKMVADAGADRGIQRIAYTKSGKTGQVTVIVVGTMAYVRGDAFTLHNYMKFTKSQSTRYAGRWISIPPPLNSAVAAAVTFSSFLKELATSKARATRVLAAKIGGQPLIGVRSVGRDHGFRVVTSLYAVRGPLRLPVREKEVVPAKGWQSVATMMRWNERVRVRRPAHAVPISTVVG